MALQLRLGIDRQYWQATGINRRSSLWRRDWAGSQPGRRI